MNRQQRRAFSRTHRVHHRVTHPEKLTHKLAPQVCVLYVPSVGEYVAEFLPTKFKMVEAPQLACRFDEDNACWAAQIVKQLTGRPVEIRPYYSHHAEQ